MFRVVSGFMLSQGLTQAMTLVIGLAIVHLLSVEQYALYSVAGAILVVVGMGSDFGMSQAFISVGSSRREDKAYIGALFNSVGWWTRRFMVVATMISIAFSYLLFMNSNWSASVMIAATLIVILIGLAQVGSKLARGVLNIHHDARSLFQVSLSESGIRMALLPLCLIWPSAILVLLVNFISSFIASRIAIHRSWRFMDRSARGGPEERKALIGFVAPLAPIIVYTVFQGQLAILLLSFYANIRSIAEISALARIGQIFTVFMLLNSFLIHPVFARSISRSDYITKLAWVMLWLATLSIVVLTSAFVVPEWWLVIVGDNYSDLTMELPIALATSLVTLVGATLYVIVIARGSTKWQSISIFPCFGSQLVFIATHEVRSTWDALIIILLPAAVYAVVQAAFLLAILVRWTKDQPYES